MTEEFRHLNVIARERSDRGNPFFQFVIAYHFTQMLTVVGRHSSNFFL